MIALLEEIATYRKEGTMTNTHIKLYFGGFLRDMSANRAVRDCLHELSEEECDEIYKLFKIARKWFPHV